MVLYFFLFFFFFNDTATTEIYTLSLHDSLPIYDRRPDDAFARRGDVGRARLQPDHEARGVHGGDRGGATRPRDRSAAEHVAARVFGRRRDLDGAVHLDRRRRRCHVDGRNRRQRDADRGRTALALARRYDRDRSAGGLAGDDAARVDARDRGVGALPRDRAAGERITVRVQRGCRELQQIADVDARCRRRDGDRGHRDRRDGDGGRAVLALARRRDRDRSTGRLPGNQAVPVHRGDRAIARLPGDDPAAERIAVRVLRRRGELDGGVHLHARRRRRHGDRRHGDDAHRDRRCARFPFTRGGDRDRPAEGVPGDEPRRVHRGDRAVTRLPRDRAARERITVRVLRRRGELHRAVHLNARGGRRDVHRGDRDRDDRDRGRPAPSLRRGRDRDGPAYGLAGDQAVRVDCGYARVTRLPRDDAAGERIAVRVLRGRGELHCGVQLNRGRAGGDVHRRDRNRDSDCRGAVLAFARSGDGDRPTARVTSHEAIRVDRGDRAIARLPRDGAARERIAVRVLRGRRELDGAVHPHARRRGADSHRRDGNRDDRNRRRAVLPLRRGGDRDGPTHGLRRDEAVDIHGRYARVTRLPGDGAAGECIAVNVARGRGELYGCVQLHARRPGGDVDRGDRNRGDGDRRRAVLAFARRGDRDRSAGDLRRDEAVRVHRSDRGVARLPGHDAAAERVAGGVLRGGGELHGRAHEHRRRRRAHVDRRDGDPRVASVRTGVGERLPRDRDELP